MQPANCAEWRQPIPLEKEREGSTRVTAGQSWERTAGIHTGVGFPANTKEEQSVEQKGVCVQLQMVLYGWAGLAAAEKPAL